VLDWERDNNDYTVLRERDDEIVTA
jgi:hypothetical protein